MDWNRLAVFVRVAEAESFTAAARALGVPKSTVSRAVSRLEADLGVRLLQRTTRKLNLTDAGRLYFERARAAMTALDEATSEVADMGTEPRGRVRVTAPVDAGVTLLAGAIARFCERHPRIEIELHLTARVVDLVEEGFDLAVRAGKLDDSSLVARRVGLPELRLYASPRYLRRRGRPQRYADLAAHDFVGFRTREGRLRMNGPSGEESVRVTGRVSVDDLSFVRKALIEDMGIGVLPAFYAAEAVRTGDLQRVLPEYGSSGAPIHVVSPSKQYEPSRVTLLRDFLVAELSAIDWQG